MALIAHEMAHLSAFKDLAEEENIVEETCLKFGETFDAAMTDEAWVRLKGALQAMQKDHGHDHPIVSACRIIEDAQEAEDFSQMKGALAAIVHPAGQMLLAKSLHEKYATDENLDGHINSYMRSYEFSLRKGI